jgi:hypothetical protein
MIPVTYAGRRVYGFTRGKGMSSGDYGLDSSGKWYVCAPVSGYEAVYIPDRMVVEHENKTITVKAELALPGKNGKPTWKGRLKAGEWSR